MSRPESYRIADVCGNCKHIEISEMKVNDKPHYWCGLGHSGPTIPYGEWMKRTIELDGLCDEWKTGQEAVSEWKSEEGDGDE